MAEEHNRVKDIIQQALEFAHSSGAEELSEAQLDLVAAGVSAPEYQQFVQHMGKKRREGYGAETNR